MMNSLARHSQRKSSSVLTFLGWTRHGHVSPHRWNANRPVIRRLNPPCRGTVSLLVHNGTLRELLVVKIYLGQSIGDDWIALTRINHCASNTNALATRYRIISDHAEQLITSHDRYQCPQPSSTLLDSLMKIEGCAGAGDFNGQLE